MLPKVYHGVNRTEGGYPMGNRYLMRGPTFKNLFKSPYRFFQLLFRHGGKVDIALPNGIHHLRAVDLGRPT